MKLQPRFYKMRPQDNLGAVLLYFTALIVGLAHAYVNEIEARHSTVFEFDTDTPLPLRIDSFCAEHRLSSLSCAQLAVFAHDRAGHVRSPRMEEAADAARRAVRAHHQRRVHRAARRLVTSIHHTNITASAHRQRIARPARDNGAVCSAEFPRLPGDIGRWRLGR